ncbi:MAG: hypothetical protein ABIL09_00515 [Gemmatimonadota bacterium]
MKFLLIPLLIIGMFVSFTAALLAMLFFTETVKSPEELQRIVLGQTDSTRLSDEFVDPEDKLGRLFEIAGDYRTLYDAERRANEDLRDSLLSEQAKAVAERERLSLEREQLGLQADSVRQQNRMANIEQLATFYNKMKPVSAAEILQEGTLPDTTVALLLKRLTPQNMAKIMASLDPDFAARITLLMQDLRPSR